MCIAAKIPYIVMHMYNVELHVVYLYSESLVLIFSQRSKTAQNGHKMYNDNKVLDLKLINVSLIFRRS